MLEHVRRSRHMSVLFWYQVCRDQMRNCRVLMIVIKTCTVWKIANASYSTVYSYYWMVTFVILHLQTVFVQMIRTLLLTLTELDLTKTHCITWRNCSKFDYVINGRPIWVRAVLQTWRATGVNGSGCERSGVLIPGGIPLFVGVSFKWDRLETSWSVRVNLLC